MKSDKGTIEKQEYVPKWEHPKILLIDMEEEAASVLKKEGYNVSTGSFGIPYKVPKSDSHSPVIMNGAHLPNYTEQEIVVIDLVTMRLADTPEGEKYTSDGKNDWWARCSVGMIDPRPRKMIYVKDDFDRILSHGGIFIVFAEPRLSQEIMWGYKYYNDIHKEQDIRVDNWSFLTILNTDNIEIVIDQGHEIYVMNNQLPIGQLLSEHVSRASLNCTLRRGWIKEESWVTLAKSKYDNPVACGIISGEEKGLIFIFPQISNKPLFLAKFIKNILPDFSPKLFPEFEGTRWVQRPEYEISEIQDLKNNIKQVEEHANQKISKLTDDIKVIRSEKSYLHDLIRSTGQPLVSAVKKTLEVLGFQSVIDVDGEAEQKGEKTPKRDDLQIRDNSPVLLVEVKGISNLPKDDEALQVWKYIAPRMKEWSRTDIQGLSIINHQRNIPPLERENNKLFRDDILVNAKDQGFGLLTTWDLFRLTRSFLKNGWKHEHIKQLFYRCDRVRPVPDHYEFIGKVEKFWEKVGAVGIRIDNLELRLNDRIAFELPVEYEEQIVDSLEVDKQSVPVAVIGMLAGIKTNLKKENLKKDINVFRIKQDYEKLS